jgi:hypothetical protein
MAELNIEHFKHAVTHRKECGCYKAEEREPKCEKRWPDICPWWSYQMHRHVSGDFRAPEWWAWTLGLRGGYSDVPPDPGEFDPIPRPAGVMIA